MTRVVALTLTESGPGRAYGRETGRGSLAASTCGGHMDSVEPVAPTVGLRFLIERLDRL